MAFCGAVGIGVLAGIVVAGAAATAWAILYGPDLIVDF